MWIELSGGRGKDDRIDRLGEGYWGGLNVMVEVQKLFFKCRNNSVNCKIHYKPPVNEMSQCA
jgi:hypothetical protein